VRGFRQEDGPKQWTGRERNKKILVVKNPVQTKSKLVLRDLDLFQELQELKVGFTITTDNEKVAAYALLL